ncbi:MAG: hypothetical protein KGN37_13640 [Burkholderiales bacterium]|nr:hypothetical protein [Burkholderiales bacterium]
MNATPHMTIADRVDKTRPHKLAMPPEVDASQSPVLIYEYLDNGELVQVPGMRDNQTPGVLAQEARIREAHYLAMAQDALNKKYNPEWQREFEHDQALRRAQEAADQAKVYDDLERMMCSGYHTSGLPLPDRVNYTRTYEAMADYMATKPGRDWMRDEISDPASCRAWEIVEQEAEEQLQYAYFFDTSDIHDREQVRRISAVDIYKVLYPD